MKRIEPLQSKAAGPCQEAIRSPEDVVPSVERAPATPLSAMSGKKRNVGTLACSRRAMFDVDGKLVCRWHAAALAFDILRKEDRPNA